jgi:hypothetical protein
LVTGIVWLCSNNQRENNGGGLFLFEGQEREKWMREVQEMFSLPPQLTMVQGLVLID